MDAKKNSLVSGRSRPDPRGSSGNLSGERAETSVPNSVGKLREVAKHTPGPWGVTLARMAKDAPIFGFHISVDGKKPAIASLGVHEPHRSIIDGSQFDRDGRKAFPADAKQYFTCEEAEANARLIAAAPELLEALKAARACIAYCRKKHKDIQNGDGVPIETFIDAAIAKAEPKRVEDGGAR